MRVAPAAVRRRLKPEGYPAQRADPCIQSDSSQRSAPAAADTESIEGTFIKPGPRALASTPSQRSARIELAQPRRRVPWRARSYAGAAQYPCAEHRYGRPRVAPISTPSEPGPDARGAPVLPNRAVNMLPWVMGNPPIRARSVGHVSAGPRPRQIYPAHPHAGRGVDSHEGSPIKSRAQ